VWRAQQGRWLTQSDHFFRPIVAPSLAVKARFAVRPWNGGDVFRYRLHSPDGDDLGEATYAQMIHAGDEIHLGGDKRSASSTLSRSRRRTSRRSSGCYRSGPRESKPC
jgi:hypothetical protein